MLPFSVTVSATAFNSLEGFIRMVDRSALREASQLLLDTVLEHGWDPSCLSLALCIQHLGTECDSRMLQFALQHLGGRAEGGRGNDSGGDGDTWHLDPRAVAREAAHIIFRKLANESGGGKAVRVAVDDFLVEWTVSIPGTMSCPPIEYLEVPQLPLLPLLKQPL